VPFVVLAQITSHWLCAILGVAALVLLALHIRSAGRVDRLRQGVERLTSGESQPHLPRYQAGRIGKLSSALGQMATEFNQRLRSIRQQRNESEAVLESMIEGVIAVDLDERVLNVNRAGAEMLQVSPGRAVGRSIQEVIRNTALQHFVAQALATESPSTADLVLRVETAGGETDERFVQVQGAALQDASGARIGVLVVLHDVTRLRRLEVVRREFVANVSHEIKTPITAIKGSVETLIDGGMHDREVNERFLGIVNRQADRLNAIVEDLLALARIEQDTERERIELAPARLCEIVQGAMEAVAIVARGKEIAIDASGGEDLEAPLNRALMEQAVVNLLDNAIKYSPSGTTIHVRCERVGDELAIAVRDEGVGIEAEHLPRLFERFYRTDRARSRAQGGTGLGLSIVKHIANAHGGRVDVESQFGAGSTFRILVPA
jgi:two-component system phosphate regulon sensor histidine kinase PhoR